MRYLGEVRAFFLPGVDDFDDVAGLTDLFAVEDSDGAVFAGLGDAGLRQGGVVVPREFAPAGDGDFPTGLAFEPGVEVHRFHAAFGLFDPDVAGEGLGAERREVALGIEFAVAASADDPLGLAIAVGVGGAGLHVFDLGQMRIECDSPNCAHPRRVELKSDWVERAARPFVPAARLDASRSASLL